MKKRTPILFAILIALFIGGTTYERLKISTERTKLLSSLRSIVSEGIGRIILTPYQPSTEQWEVVLSGNESINVIETSIRNADVQSVMGHSMSTGEWTISFVTRSGEKYSFLADVFNHQENDIFLSDSFPTETQPRQWTGNGPRRIRLPDSASWIIKQAPQGIIGNS
jgi:hypothetical protein